LQDFNFFNSNDDSSSVKNNVNNNVNKNVNKNEKDEAPCAIKFDVNIDIAELLDDVKVLDLLCKNWLLQNNNNNNVAYSDDNR
jgi:hypothetical protein